MRSACATGAGRKPAGTAGVLRHEGEIAGGRTDCKSWIFRGQPSLGGSLRAAGAPCDALEESDALTQTAPVALPRKARRESRERSSVRPELHISRVPSPARSDMSFYARHRGGRDHAKMDPVAWHNHGSDRIGRPLGCPS